MKHILQRVSPFIGFFKLINKRIYMIHIYTQMYNVHVDSSNIIWEELYMQINWCWELVYRVLWSGFPWTVVLLYYLCSFCKKEIHWNDLVRIHMCLLTERCLSSGCRICCLCVFMRVRSSFPVSPMYCFWQLSHVIT